MSQEPDERIVQESLAFYGQTLDWLEAHHADYAVKAELDLGADERLNAVWKLSGQSLSLSRTLLALLADGYTSQAWPVMRAIHEANRLLGAVADSEEEQIVRRWLADQQVKQSEVRAAEQREADRISKQMQEAGLEPLAHHVEELSRVIYRRMSKAAHHQRSVVDEAVDAEARTMIYGPDPRGERRLEFAVFAGSLLQEVLIKVGDALSLLWGPPFYRDHLTPMLERYQKMMDALEIIETARRLGLAGGEQ